MPVFHAKVASLPENFLVWTDQACRPASDGSLTRLLHGPEVKVEISREVETVLDTGSDDRDQFELCHRNESSIAYNKRGADSEKGGKKKGTGPIFSLKAS